MSDREDAPIAPEDPPPVLGSWNRIYALVIGVLAACIGLFWLFARTFS
jgi:hypothetical protein